MRLAPVPLFFARDPAVAIARAGDGSRTTHASEDPVDACRYLAALIVGALQGRSRTELFEPLFTPVDGLWNDEPLSTNIAEIGSGTFLRYEPPAALWALAKSTPFADGALLAVNLGDDADTTGAVYGQLAGAYYGVESIPERGRSKLAGLDVLEQFAERLWTRSTDRAVRRDS